MSRRVILSYLLGGIVMAASFHLALSQETSTTTCATTDSSVVIFVPRDGEFYFGIDKITQDEIPDRLKNAFKDKPLEGRRVSIKAGLDVSYKTVVSVVDTIRGAGFDEIDLVTNDESESKAKTKSTTRGAGKGKTVRGRRHTHRYTRRQPRSL